MSSFHFSRALKGFVAVLSPLWLATAGEPKWIRIPDPGNAAEPRLLAGSVGYEFEIMETEVTNVMYSDFLNAVAKKSDPYGLYTSLMAEHFFGGIIQDGREGEYVYRVKPGYENLPAVFISWFDAIRYVNWLNYGMPTNGESVLGTTEGTAKTGAYNTSEANAPAKRNPTAAYWLPNRNEWIKAGFYDGKGTYRKYATNSDQPPSQNPQDANSANYYQESWALPFPHLAPVMLYLERSHYGTLGQGGNAAEWVEDICNSDQWRYALGGSLFRYRNSLEIGYVEGDEPHKKLSTFSFRPARRIGAAAPTEKPAPGFAITPPPSVKNHETEYVIIDDAGNAPDCFYGNYGTVAYPFMLARCEISNRQWVDFLNSVATQSDPFGLYNPAMTTGALGGIDRIVEADGHFVYRCKANWENRPVNYIGWYDLARYANWMHYDRPSGGKSELGSTEGNARQGAYDTTDFEDIRSGHKKVYHDFGKRNSFAKYWIPNQNEWYKAAYYDPKKFGPRKYWNFATRTDDPPVAMKSSLSAGGCNYLQSNHLAEGPPYFLAEVDSYKKSPSYYGTVQQGGNVWEWLEDWQYGVPGIHGLRGGSFGYTQVGLHAANCDPGGINEESYVFGGRLAKRLDGVEGFPELGLSRRIWYFLTTLSTGQWIKLSGGIALAAMFAGLICGWVSVKLRTKRKR